MTTKTLDLNNIERKIFWTLATCLGVVLAFYLYSVVSLTLAVVARNGAEQATHELANTSSTLEAEYLAQTKSITLAYAQSLGFNEVAAKYAGSRATEAQTGVVSGTVVAMAR